MLAGCMSVREAEAAIRLFTNAASGGARRRSVAITGTPAGSAQGAAASIACFAYGSCRPAKAQDKKSSKQTDAFA